MEVEWGYADLQRGSEAVALALSRGHLREGPDGMMYLKTADITSSTKSSQGVAAESAGSSRDYEHFKHGTLQDVSWANFVFKDVPAAELAITYKAPPTSEAQQHVQTAVDKCQATIKDVRNCGRLLGQLKVEEHLRARVLGLTRSLQLSRQVETEFLESLDTMIIMNTFSSRSTAELKQTLQKLAPFYDELEALRIPLTSALTQPKKTKA